MRYPAAETAAKHRKILQMATRLFKEKGFNNVSVDLIMEASGLTRGGFYNHFKSKNNLIEDVLNIGSAQTLDLIRAYGAGGEGRADFVGNYLSKARISDPAEGTIEATLATDVAREPSLQPLFTAHLDLTIEEIKRRFVRGDAAHPNAEAICLLCMLVGAAELARATDSEEMRQRIIQAVQRSADAST